MTDTNENDFHWNVYFIGAEGFREHFYVSASDPVSLANKRETLLGFLKEWGAITDVRNVWSEPVKAGPSKLDKFKQMDKAADDFVAETAKAGAEAIAAEVEKSRPEEDKKTTPEEPSKTSKLAKFTRPTPSEPVNTVPGDLLKASKLAKYAKPEKG